MQALPLVRRLDRVTRIKQRASQYEDRPPPRKIRPQPDIERGKVVLDTSPSPFPGSERALPDRDVLTTPAPPRSCFVDKAMVSLVKEKEG